MLVIGTFITGLTYYIKIKMSGNPFDEYETTYEGESWDYFIQDMRNRPASTRRVYYLYITTFFDELGYEPDEFYEHVKEQLQGEDRRTIKALENEIIGYYKGIITDKELSYTSAQNTENAVNAFLKANMIDLPFRLSQSVNDLKRTHEESFKVNGKNKAEIENIKKLIEYTGEPRNISAITFLKDSGLRVGDIVRLKIKHIQPIIDNPDLDWYLFKITPEKNLSQNDPLEARVCIGKDAIKYLKIWLEHRETKYGLSNSDPQAPLYCAVYNRGKTRIGDPIIPNAITTTIANIRKKAGINTGISPHSFRKMFSTNLLYAGVDERYINIMQGKRGKGTQGVYIQPTDQELLEQYKKGYPGIALEPETASKEEVDTLKQQLQEFKQRLEKYENMSTYLITEKGRPLTPEETTKWRKQQYGTEPTANTQAKTTEIIESDKVEQIAELMEQGYEIAFENGSKVIMKLHQNGF